ncbi:ABC transporter ATP-binding protein [Solirhodobacter olei]|uniref:ABC transporter ATP-binding protein n=1 Tax=Solirhodobacter olei TaxID=2493082 RepID=UPI000FD7F4F8|nr:ABC transporter ATP-binding protein [Solirhodobacter olei]
MKDVDAAAGAFSTAAEEEVVRLTGLSVSLGGAPVLSDVGLTLRRGRVTALLGPSGCGKTTLLRVVAGLLEPEAGIVHLRGRLVADPRRGVFVPPEARGLAMVFQDYALWPHMTVAANVGFPLEMQGVPARRRAARVDEALARVGLSKLAARRPGDLSGGQQQRVAIARAIVTEPELVLFDEPLSNLDRELREIMVEEIASHVADLGLSALYVTHDQTEAFSLADEVAVMRQGRIEQLAPPEDLLAAPASPHVAEFLRLGAVLPVVRGPDGWHLPGGAVIAPASAVDAASRVLLRARAVRVVPPDGGRVEGRVLRGLFRGDGYSATVELAGGHRVQIVTATRLAPGSRVGLDIPPEALHWF